MTSDAPRQLELVRPPLPGGADRRIAAEVRRARDPCESRPGLVWLGGFRSDMTSGKAVALDAWAERIGRAMLRFDYFGHGRSSGRFEDGTISVWLDDTMAAIAHFTGGPQILVGSSMGAWIALLAARALHAAGQAERLAGMVLIAPAVDFTEALMWARFPPEIRETIEAEGVWLRPSAYSDEPIPVTRALVEDGRRHLLLGATVRSHCPVHILQGMRDPDVPWEHAMTLVEHFAVDPVSITLIKDGDHRLSREEDIARIIAAVEGIA